MCVRHVTFGGYDSGIISQMFVHETHANASKALNVLFVRFARNEANDAQIYFRYCLIPAVIFLSELSTSSKKNEVEVYDLLKLLRRYHTEE